jgi:hypothetical protein
LFPPDSSPQAIPSSTRRNRSLPVAAPRAAALRVVPATAKSIFAVSPGRAWARPGSMGLDWIPSVLRAADPIGSRRGAASELDPNTVSLDQDEAEGAQHGRVIA